ncbi:MAG TPA: hypothetical protein VIF62_30220, partial [Labilithrix sp.]
MRRGWIVLASWVVVVGCGASEAPTASADDLRVDASAAAHAELGVATWIVTRGASRLSVRGLTDDGGDAHVSL